MNEPKVVVIQDIWKDRVEAALLLATGGTVSAEALDSLFPGVLAPGLRAQHWISTFERLDSRRDWCELKWTLGSPDTNLLPWLRQWYPATAEACEAELAIRMLKKLGGS